MEETTWEKQAQSIGNIKMDHKEAGFEGVDWIILAQD
jgi:hypothetical protein